MIKDLRFDLSVASLFFYIFGYAIHKTRYIARHKDKYSVQDKFDFGCDIMDTTRRHARTTTIAYGQENIPEDKTTVFYSNHQGKYDALGILLSMKGRPTSVLWEEKRANRILAREMAFLCNAILIDLESMRGKAKGILEAINLVKTGMNILVFPEGKTDPRKGNSLGKFQSGCFAISLKTNTAIVPVAIYDSYLAMNGNNIFGHVTTQVHFLSPIMPEEYAGMSKQELSDMVESRIAAKIEALDASGASFKKKYP